MKIISFTTWILLLIGGLFVGCQSVNLPLQSGGEDKFRSIEQYIERSPAINSYFFGLELYDLQEQKEVVGYQADKLFTPASNTKLLTLFTCLQVLPDSIAFVNEYKVGGKTIYQPMGDPSFLHPDVEGSSQMVSFFKNLPQDTVYFSLAHFKDGRFGSGWAWDDFMGYYQTEKSAFPIQSNWYIHANDQSSLPPQALGVILESKSSANRTSRGEFDNHIISSNLDKSFQVPLHITNEVFSAYMHSQDKELEFVNGNLPEQSFTRTIYSLPAEAVYKPLMKNSDNHIAEQLLLQASQVQLGEMSSEEIIDYAKEHYFKPVASQLHWVDGSGLSRYNLMSPKAFVWVMNELVQQKGIDWVKTIFPNGGVDGTIRNNYAFEQPRVFAKTGTLRNNHNLTGLVQAKSGKWYAFSMMNNHYDGSSSFAKHEMENILKLVVELY